MDQRIRGSVGVSLGLIIAFLFLLPLTVHAFTIKGSVQNVQESQNNFQTYIDVEIGTDFTGTLPDDIASIAVTGSGGMVLSKADLSFSGRIFSKQIPGSPALGLYAFSVTSSSATGALTATATDEQTINRSIPFADSTKFTPAAGTVISIKTPTFSWQQISYPEATVYYRLEIRDVATNTQVYLSTRKSNISSFTIPANVLQPGLSYKWRIRTSDSNDWIKVMNRSNSAWLTFTTASALQHASPPALFLDGWGVATANFKGDPNAYYDVWIKVTDLDGVASDGSSHTVTMKTPAGVIHTLGYDSSDSATTAAYTKFINLGSNPHEAEAFTFTARDPDGNEASIVDTLVVNLLPAPEVSSFSLKANSVLADTTPTITWDPVVGAQEYQVRIYNADGSRTVWYGNTGHQASYTMPPGVLSPNTAYRYRINARDAHSPFERDNSSWAPNNNASAIPFTTGSRTDSPYISLSDGVSTYSDQGMHTHPTRLSFYILVYDAQGVPGNIRSVRVIFPSGHQEPLYYDNGSSDNTSIRGAYVSTPDLPPEAGSYTFIAEDWEGNIYSISEVLTVNPIGYPAETSLRPLMNAVTNGTAVDFDWDDVPGAVSYRLRIYDINFNQVLSWRMTESGYALPAGFLKPGSLYRYKINAYREFSIDGMDNSSSAAWGNADMPTFMTGPLIGGSSLPMLDLRNSGVYTDHMTDPRTGNSLYRLSFYTRVTDLDGVPANIASVRVTYPDGVTQRDLRLDSVVSGTQANYYTREFNPNPVQPGDYIFTVTDRDGNSAQATDTLVINLLPYPVNLSPRTGAVVAGTTPTIRWDPVPGASDYEVRINDGWDQQIYRSNRFPTNSFTVPAGILQMDATYSYTVYAHREPSGQDLDNRSLSDCTTNTEMRHFTTTAFYLHGDVDGNRELTLADAILALKVVSGLPAGIRTDYDTSGSDVNGDLKIGLEEAIYILQTVSGLR